MEQKGREENISSHLTFTQSHLKKREGRTETPVPEKRREEKRRSTTARLRGGKKRKKLCAQKALAT
jgi:hypothetical protein